MKKINQNSYARKLFAIIVICGVALAFFSNARIVLYMQGLFKIMPSEFLIGSAKIKKDDNWLLVSGRDSPEEGVRLYGVLSSWLFYDYSSAPVERYFSFIDTNSNNTNFTFSEISTDVSGKLKKIIKEGVSNNKTQCEILEAYINNLTVVRCSVDNGIVLYVPDMGFNVIVLSKREDPRKYLRLTKL